MIPLDMLKRGFFVVPLDGKRATLTGAGGFRNSTRDPEVIARWERRFPGCNWGVHLPGIMQIDTDPQHGGTVEDLDLPPTLVVRTGSGGTHHHFTFDGAVRGRLADREGVDIRTGSTGYVVAPPSIHPVTGRRYEIIDDSDIAPLPPRLHPLVIAPRYTPRPTVASPERRSNGLVDKVASAKGGGRNAITFWAFCRAFERGGEQSLLVAIRSAALGTGLPEHEVETCLRSARRTVGSAA